MDHSFIMLLRAMMKVNVRQVYCAGLDGYSEKGENYFKPDMEYWFTKREVATFNGYVMKCLQEFRSRLEVDFVTTSFYQE